MEAEILKIQFNFKYLITTNYYNLGTKKTRKKLTVII